MASIVVRCEQCSKRYQISERLAGKRIRCKNCGGIMSVPAAADAPAPSAADAATLPHAHEHDEDPFAAVAAAAPPAFSETSTTGDEGSSEGPGPPGIARARLDFPHRKEVVLSLPWVLVGIGLLLFGMTCFRYASDADRPWLVFVQFGLALVLYLVLVIPLTIVASRVAGRKRGFTLLPPAWSKMAAAFAVPLGLMYVFEQLSGKSGYAIGFLLGLPIAFFTLWLLFRLQLIQAVWSSIYSGVTFVICAVGVALLSLLVQHVIGQAVTGYEQRAEAEAQKHALPAPPKKTARNESQQPSPTTQPGAGGATLASATTQPLPPVGVPAGAPPINVAVAPTPTDPFATPSSHKEPPPSATIAPPEPRTETIVTQPPGQGSPQPGSESATGSKPVLPPFIKEIVSPQSVGDFDRLVYPSTPSDWMSVVRRRGADEDVVERFDTKSLQRTGRATFKHEPGKVDTYILSPAGDFLARVARWPQLSAQVWSFEKDQLFRPLELSGKLGDPELLAFLGSDQFVIHWGRKTEPSLEVWDISAAQSRRPIPVVQHDRTAGNLAVSPDGKTLAIVAKGPGLRNEVMGHLYLYDMTPGPQRSPRKLPIQNLDRQWPVRPSGVAFSPDGTHVAVLFEQNNNALLLCWSLDDFKIEQEHTYPGGLLPSKDLPTVSSGRGGDQVQQGERIFTSRALDWLADGKTWLIYGSGLFDVNSGRLVGQLGVTGARAQRVVGDDVHLVTDAPTGRDERRLSIVKLDLGKLAEWKVAPRRPVAPDE